MTVDLSKVYVAEAPTISVAPSPLERLISGELFDSEVLLNVDVAWPPEA
jgi:hypothetical protein